MKRISTTSSWQLNAATKAVHSLISGSGELTKRLANEIDMNPTDMTALYLLSEKGPMWASELADWLGIRSASMTILIDRMEAAGHLQRKRDVRDRRKILVSETASARKLIYSAWQPVIEEMNQVSLSLTDNERDIIVSYLQKITNISIKD